MKSSCNIKNEFKRFMHFFSEAKKERKNFIQQIEAESFEFFNVYDDLLDDDRNGFFKKIETQEMYFINWTNDFYDSAKLKIIEMKAKL